MLPTKPVLVVSELATTSYQVPYFKLYAPNFLPYHHCPGPGIRLYRSTLRRNGATKCRHSFASSPTDSLPDEKTLVSVSTTFSLAHRVMCSHPILTCCHWNSFLLLFHPHILAASNNNFSSLLPPSSRTDPGPMVPVVLLPESSLELNIVLHVIYNISCSSILHPSNPLY
ncbi:hypothetical protein F5141DRAFT_140747 [Pisolithus sp. B1]|nr:hypothetical protein F5141DRAFT_140747 [Pisolithus sp. B1]